MMTANSREFSGRLVPCFHHDFLLLERNKNKRFETTNSWIVWHIMTFFLRWVHTLLLTLRNFIIHPNPNSCSAQPQADPAQCTNVHARWQSASQEVIYQTIWCTLPARVNKRDRQGPWKESTTPSQADMIWAIFSRCLFGVIPFFGNSGSIPP